MLTQSQNLFSRQEMPVRKTKPQLANAEEKSSSVDVSNFLAFEIFHDCVVRLDLALANQNDSKDFG